MSEMVEAGAEVHTVPAADFERGIEYGRMIHRLDEHESKISRMESQHAEDMREFRERLDTANALGEVALHVASDAQETAEGAEHVADLAHVETDEAPAEVEVTVVEEAPDTEEVTIVGDDEGGATAEPEVEKEPPARKRRKGVYGRR